LEVDIQGAETIRKTDLDPYFLFISPPSFQDLEARLHKRGSETPASLKRRLSTAKRELEYLQSGAYFHYQLKNDDLSTAYYHLRSKLLEFYPYLKEKFPTSSLILPADIPTIVSPPSSPLSPLSPLSPSNLITSFPTGNETVVTISENKKRRDSLSTGIKPLVVCGPSGVGKGTLLDMLIRDFPNLFKRTVSHTTRKPREGEKVGVHYYFVTKEEFQADIKAEKFIEYAEVHGNFYGTSIDTVEMVVRSGQICILEVDVQGVESLRKTHLNPYFIFISPPSLEELKSRIVQRGSETSSSLERRLETAKRELDYLNSGAHFHFELKNDDLHKSYHLLRSKLTELYPHIAEKCPRSIHTILPDITDPVTKSPLQSQEIPSSKHGKATGTVDMTIVAPTVAITIS